MQDVFNYRDEVINEYQSFSRSFTNISAPDIKAVVDKEYEEGRYWPDPLIQINPNYKTEKNINELCDDGTLENECRLIFQVDKKEDGSDGKTMTLYSHQQQAIAFAAMKQSYVVTTGTGSGKSLSFFIPIVNEIIKNRANNKGRTSAIIIYPMNALANSQLEEIRKFLRGYTDGNEPFTVGQYTGQENEGITDEKFVDREFSESFLPPYIFDDVKRAVLRAELDAYYARLYGLTRTELQYILDPHSVMGEDYPSETFRVLKDNEIAKYGEYRTQRLVLEAWDKME